MRAFVAKTVVLLLLATGTVALAPARAQAATLPPTFSADPLPTWQTNGAVWALETIGNVVYVGGVFSKVRPPGTAEGSTQEVTRNNLAAFDATTGNLLPCNPSITFPNSTPRVLALDASPSGDRLYVGGTFSRVGDTGVANLVALNPSTCALLGTTTFRRPAVTAAVRAISASASNVYVGGDFSTVDGQTRPKFAELSGNGTLLAGSVNLDGSVRTVLALPDVGKVLVGGDFNTVNGAAVHGLVAVHPTTSAVVQTFPGWFPTASVPKTIIRDGASVYLGGEGSGYGVFDGRIAADVATLSMKWKDHCLGATQALAVDAGVLYAGHHAHECQTTPGGWLEDGFRNHFTGQDVVTKEIIPTFFPDTDDGIGVAPQGPRALVVSNGVLWSGGEFTLVNDRTQRGLTRFGKADTGATAAPPIAVSTAKAGTNIVTWTAGYDRDDDALTYELYRNGTLVSTQTARSREWARPPMSFVDAGLAGGQSASYRLRVLEPDGQNAGALGATVTVTTSSTNKGYAGTVLADNPSLYWKLDEKTEQDARTRNGALYRRTNVADASGNSIRGTAERGYTTLWPDGYALGGPSALADASGTSVTFNGAAGRVAEGFTNDFRPVRSGPSQYSVELWFKTAGTTGGRLAGFGSRRTELYERTPPGTQPPVYHHSTSATTDRQLYLTDAGKLVFGTLNGTTKVTAKSAAAYNDLKWHHAVATSGPAGMRLYVDGVQVASNPNTANGSYVGYWKVGFDNLTGWLEKPANTALKGGVDEFAVYPVPLSAARVAAHYQAGRPGAVIDTQAPTAPTGLSATATGQSVSLTWTAASDNAGVSGYEVHRTATSGEALSAASRVAAPSSTSFTEQSVPAGTWYYRVVAVDTSGNVGPPSAADAVTVTATSTPTTTTVAPLADTYVNSALRTTSYGTSWNVIADSDPAQIAYLRYQLPAAPAGKVLTGAVLRVRTHTAESSSSLSSHQVQRAENTWSETAVTWDTRPAAIVDTLGTIPAGTAVNTSYDVALSAAKVSALLGSQTTLALVGGGSDSLLLSTRESGATRAPQLILQFGDG